MQIDLFHLDAFTDHLFGGNPAAVCLLSEWLADDILQKIAAENNLSETAFLIPRDDNFHIRWFTPICEVDLCGHATLAAGYIVFNHLKIKPHSIIFYSASGDLILEKQNNHLIKMDFPVLEFQTDDANSLVESALGAKPTEIYKSKDHIAIFENERILRELTPNFELLKKLPTRGVIATAKGDHVDFVSRFFAPKVGVNEDPVTGSAHCVLAPLWSEKLHKSHLHAKQLSQRGGEVYCDVHGSRVMLQGKVVLYSQGKIFLS